MRNNCCRTKSFGKERCVFITCIFYLFLLIYLCLYTCIIGSFSTTHTHTKTHTHTQMHSFIKFIIFSKIFITNKPNMHACEWNFSNILTLISVISGTTDLKIGCESWYCLHVLGPGSCSTDTGRGEYIKQKQIWRMDLFIDVVHSCIYVSHSLPKYDLAGFVKKKLALKVHVTKFWRLYVCSWVQNNSRSETLVLWYILQY